MKKIVILLILILSLYSCKNSDEKIIKNTNWKLKNNLEEKQEIENNNFLSWTEISNDEVKIKKEEIGKEFKKIENEANNIEKTEIKTIIDYSQIKTENITEKFLDNNIQDKYLLVDLEYEKSHNKLNKILKLVNNLSKKWKINHFELHCKNLNFNKDELNILKNLNLKIFSLEDMCGFKKENFSQTWYNKEKVINFLKNSKNIKELYIWYIGMDLFKKENWEIKFYSWN